MINDIIYIYICIYIIKSMIINDDDSSAASKNISQEYNFL
jgi:hypothetical protein